MNPTQDVFLLDCETYEDYLDTYILRNDLRYLRNISFCRMLVELGYRSTAEIYSPEQYEIRKAAAQEMMHATKKSNILFSDGVTITDPILIELAKRERANYQKVVSTIIYARHRDKSGFEMSGYIDFEHSLKKANLHTEDSIDWGLVFKGRKPLRPTPTDLSFVNGRTGVVCYSNSDNYSVLIDHENGLTFLHKGDRKKICVGSATKEMFTANFTRTMVYSEKFGHAILYDHVIRKKI